MSLPRLRALIERNRNPRIMSADQFTAWVEGPKVDLFIRRAAECLEHAALAYEAGLTEKSQNLLNDASEYCGKAFAAAGGARFVQQI